MKTGELNDGVISRFEEHISAEGLSSSSAKLLPAGTVLMAMYGATVGKLGILADPASCNQASCALIPDPLRCDGRWLFYALLNDRDHIISRANGAAQQNLSGTTIKGFSYLVPDVSEQRAIGEVLGALDGKIAANTKLAEISMELAGEIYRHGVASFPDKPMNEVLSPILGGTPARVRDDFWGGSALWASAKDVTGADNGVITDTEEKITDAACTQTKAKPLPAGSVILTARGTVGAVARLAVPASFNQSCYGFVPDALPPGLLYFGVLSAATRAKKIAHGSVFDTITMKTFAHLRLPDMTADQIAHLESLVSPKLDVSAEAVRENATLAATRDTLLPQLMSGKLRVGDISL